MRYRWIVLGVLLVAGCREPQWAPEGGFEDASSDAGGGDAAAVDSNSVFDAGRIADAAESVDAPVAEDSGAMDAEALDATPADAVVAMDAQEAQVCGDGHRTGTEACDYGTSANGATDCTYGEQQ